MNGQCWLGELREYTICLRISQKPRSLRKGGVLDLVMQILR
jgi:hypothetical protein